MDSNGKATTSKEAADPVFNQFVKRVEVMVGNEMTSRANFLNRIFDRRRDIDEECGWAKVITPLDYQAMYERGDVPARVVEVWAKESWQVSPEVYESEDPEEETAFEASLANVAKALRGEHSWFEPEECNPLWAACLDADVKSGIGRYGVILLGVDDRDDRGQPKDLSSPLLPPREGEPLRKLLYLRVLPESMAPIIAYETNHSNCRYGKPTFYEITVGGGDDQVSQSGNGVEVGSSAVMVTTSKKVHWSRVVHVCEGETFHAPRMQHVWNRLLDLRKLYGGSAEMYWKGAFPGFSLETHPQLGGDVKVDVEALRDRMEQFWNSLDRTMLNVGMHAQMMSPTVVDPTPQIAVQVEAICIKLECPVPVFKGYEIGEQASTNNDSDWRKRVAARRRNVCTPKHVVPLIDRLVQVGVVAKPLEGYRVWWPDGISKTDGERADVASKNTASLVAYVSGGGSQLIPERFFLTSPTFLGMPDDEAEEILDGMSKGPDDGGDPSQDPFLPQPDPFAADEYAAANLERITMNCGGKGGTPGPCKVDEEKESGDPVGRAVASLKALHEEMLDPADADAKLARIRQAGAALRGMSKEAVFKVAEGVGVTYFSPKTKGAAVKRIENNIIERLSTAIRHPFKQGGA